MRVVMEMITPKRAKALLDRNDNNRPLRKARWMEYARRRLSGQWKCNGETIKVAPDGRLLDGQHRLKMVVHTGMATQMCVAYDVSPDVFDTLDTGMGRTAGDALGMLGIPNAKNTAAAIRTILAYRDGCIAKSRPQYSNADVLMAQQRLCGLDYSVQKAGQWDRGWRSVFGSPLAQCAITSAMHFMFSKSDAGLAEKFFAELSEGVFEGSHTHTYPVLRLRDYLAARCGKNGGGSQNQKDTARLFIKTWNALRSGAGIGNMRLAVGKVPENEQVISGAPPVLFADIERIER